MRYDAAVMLRRSWALVTGASGGLGHEIALLLAQKGWNLILTARTEAKLIALKDTVTSLNVDVRVVPADLSAPDSAEKLYAACGQLRDERGGAIDVSLLVNNAGAGMFGESVDSDAASLIRLNMESLTGLCALFGRGMKQKHSGNILNIGSLTANQPTPYFASYGASKAYVRHYSLALRQELAPYGVRVTCAEPGYIRTSFDDNSRITSGRYKRFSYNNGMEASTVAKIAVRAMEKNRALVTAGFFNSLSAFCSRLLPLPFLAFALARSVRFLTKEKT
jgi:short-subunit dehydrogenase